MPACLRGLFAASCATALLVVLLWIDTGSGVAARDLPGLLARVLGESRGVGWLVLLAVSGPGIGLVLAALAEDAPGTPWAVALLLSVGGWLAAMMGLLPMAGYAPFALGSGPWLALVTLAWSAAHGVVLALGWGLLPRLEALLLQWRGQLPPAASLRS